MVQNFTIRFDDHYLIWFFTRLRVKYDLGFCVCLDDGLVKVNQKLHLAYLKFMFLITFNIPPQSPIWGVTFLTAAHYSCTRIKLSYFIITTWPDWSIFVLAQRGGGRWREERKNKKTFYSLTYQNSDDCCARVTLRKAFLEPEKGRKRREKNHRKIWLWFNWYSWWQLIESHWKFVSNQWPWR